MAKLLGTGKMTCEQCSQLMSLFLDNELSEKSSAEVREHLFVCDECLKLCEELAMIVNFCQLDADAQNAPLNSQALWCRINNIIESEVQAEIKKETGEKSEAETQKEKSARLWSFSFPQIFASVMFIALISSILTLIGVRQYTASPDSWALKSEPTVFERILGKFGLVETRQQALQRRLKEREAAIEYWNKRVQERRARWNAHLRETFDRNLNEINQAVNEYTLILQENPQDELSGEMLDSALEDKMDLLRAFSEL